ncbi:hypothetical protein ILUMI_08097 [Ignelater luminosus]|uniref:EF-hand domain-containing protein n=1 Tax=Ignelater luminosus TaxID=2038154 RepID=A0A8K0GHD5_IGNLU|nr:hypothetical protein ILUMI_08097 [Ignelater luminosus]
MTKQVSFADTNKHSFCGEQSTSIGYISLEEFSDACNLIREHMPNPISQDQLIDMCRLMDMNKDGLVDLNEFLETFRMVDPEQQGMGARFFTDTEDVAVENLKNSTANGLPGSGKEDVTPAQEESRDGRNNTTKSINETDVPVTSSPKKDFNSSIFGSPVHNSVCQNNIDSPLLSSPKASSVTVTINNTSPISSPNTSPRINALNKSPVMTSSLLSQDLAKVVSGRLVLLPTRTADISGFVAADRIRRSSSEV